MAGRDKRGSEPTAGPGSPRHTPVLLRPVVAALAPEAGRTYLDATFGAGGYTSAILAVPGTRVVALDRDAEAIAAGQPLVDDSGGRLRLVETPFSELAEVARSLVPEGLAGIVLDIGVSSMQIDEPARGFSFQADGPLDMRMSRTGPTAADVVNTLEAEPLADIIYGLGEEKRSRAIARAIVRAREQAPITTTLGLARIVTSVLGERRIEGRHPATRTFQALRIHVNDELGELDRALHAAEQVLPEGGRLVVVTFHSIEDRIAKRFLAERCNPAPAGSRHLPQGTNAPAASFQFINRKAVKPDQDEIAANPRARSAKLRAAIRTAAPPLSVRPA